MAALTNTLMEAPRPDLEVAVFVHRAAGVRGHESHGGQVHILAREDEEVHAAALRHTLFGQLLIHSFLRLEQGLEEQNKSGGLNALADESSAAHNEVLTFSFSVLTTFLSSLFFSLPGASAVGMDEWKMKSFPLHSAAWGRERRAC